MCAAIQARERADFFVNERYYVTSHHEYKIT